MMVVPIVMVLPQARCMVYFMDKAIYKWMMTGGPRFLETTIMMGYRSNYLCLMFKQTHTGHTICKQTALGFHIMKRYIHKAAPAVSAIP